MIVRTTALVLALATPAEAQQSFRGDYSVSLWGITIGRSTFTSSFDGDAFSVEGSVSSAGLARIFDSTKGAVSVSGRLAGEEVRPAAYRMSYTSGKRSKKTEIDFAKGGVARTEIVPTPRKRTGDWVALDANDLARVTDPLSSSLVRAENLAAVCGKTLRVYDGVSRMDLKLAHAGTGPVSIPGYAGDAVTCSARFVPVSGYRPGHRSIEFLKNRSNIRIAFAPLGATGVYAPVRASIDTEIGTLTIRAERYGPK